MNADPTTKPVTRNNRLVETLIDILGSDQVITDEAERCYYASDIYSVGVVPRIAIQSECKICGKSHCLWTRDGRSHKEAIMGLSRSG